MAVQNKVLQRRALLVQQQSEYAIYLFCLTGSEILEIADISRVSRDDAGSLIGYQRPSVKQHVEDIVAYLNGESVVFPNAIILALSPKVEFVRSRGPQTSDGLATAGTLKIPLPQNSEPRPAWIVDGQQRAVALSRSNRNTMPIPVAAFVAPNVELQRDQFLRINNTRPLPRGLISELLPEVDTPLPVRMAATRIPSTVCEKLNQDINSPFLGLIRRSSMSHDAASKAVIADASIIKMVQESIGSPAGILFPFRNVATGETDITGMAAVLIAYWTSVRNVFPEAWGLPATQSRLMHGVGIRAMGRVMDRVMSSLHGIEGAQLIQAAENELKALQPHCRWTAN